MVLGERLRPIPGGLPELAEVVGTRTVVGLKGVSDPSERMTQAQLNGCQLIREFINCLRLGSKIQ